MTIREGKWDCPQCGCKGNRGSELKCKQCNKIRGNEVKFYVEDDAAEVIDQKKLERALSGADWICQFCDAINPAGGASCKSCHAERTEKKREVKEILDQPASPPPPKKKSSTMKIVGAVLGGLALMCGAGFFICGSSERQLTLAEVSWERTVEVEKYGTVTEEAWANELPSGARVQSTTSKVHHTDHIQTGTHTVSKDVDEKVQTGTRTVKVGKKDMGNGYFEDITKEEPVYEHRTKTVTREEPVYRDDPVYKDWATYQIEKWHKDRVEKAAGSDTSPAWPELRLTAGKEREGKKVEKYVAVFKDEKGKQWTWKEAPLEKWQGLKVGQGYKVVTKLGEVQGLAEGK
jgi:hypothetical protein